MAWTPAAAPAVPAWTLGGFASSTSTYSTPSAPVRTAVGLLAWSLASESNDGSIASRSSFSASQWDPNGASPNVASLHTGGSLKYTGAFFNTAAVLLNTSVDSRVTLLVQARCRNGSGSGDLTWVGPAVRCEATGKTGTSSISAIVHAHPASSVTRNLGIMEVRGNSQVVTSLVSALRPQDTLERSAIWSSGVSAAVYDFVGAQTFAIDLQAQAVAARPGLLFGDASGGGSGMLLCAEWLACTDRYVSVTGAGLVAGYLVRVERSDGSVMASATAVTSAATLDLLSVVLDGAHTRLAVYDSSTSLLSVLTVASPGIWPGDVFTVGSSVATAIVGVASAWTPSAAPSTTWTTNPSP